MLTDGTKEKPWTSADKSRLIARIIKRVYDESFFVESSGYVFDTLRIVLKEEL